MAGTITAGLQCQVSHDKFLQNANVPTVTMEQTNQGGGQPGTLTITTSEADISVPGLATPGWCVIQNLDATNYFTIGPKSGGAMVALAKVLPGEFACFRLAGSVVLRAIAHTASVLARIQIFET
jgi:uncharacterized protein YjdB